MATEQGHGRPRLAPGYRMQWEQAQNCHVLLYPEGMVKLNGSAHEILSRCDGDHAAGDIVAELRSAFPGVVLNDEVDAFLRLAIERGWLVLQ
ncbi:MAG: pyrroloquinoline quinone biosynthesis peptide chaperone PqqD [Salinisphaera sp.]|nr:pyrroloquinoline quinone biosynthesis peptide chaperone PqqD [Salinisphaera sp.]MDN5937331.1 pyrroloquinoline quinone biosynthesis peptide chaperone PqqD [Salinisphaera sp.]